MEFPAGMNPSQAEAAVEIAALAQFTGESAQFWNAFLPAAARLVGAELALILRGQPGAETRWVTVIQWAARHGPSSEQTPFTSQLERIAAAAIAAGQFQEQTDTIAGIFTLAIRLPLSRREDELVLALQIRDYTVEAVADALARLTLCASVPLAYQLNLSAQQARQDVEKFAMVLDLNVSVNQSTRFLAAALALCNTIATRLRCDRVSLGWLAGGYVRLRAISRTEHFDRQMAAAQALEVMMEECADQDEELLWPASKDQSAVTRDHEKFASEQKVSYLLSLPLRMNGKVVGVLSCERNDGSFNVVEIQQLRLGADQVVRRLDDLARSDHWLGVRWLAEFREGLARFLGPERTWSKVAAIGGAILLALLFLIRPHYRVEGNFILRSGTAEYLTAPFDAYIEEVLVRPGDSVTNGQVLLNLNSSELLLEQAASLADCARYQREAEKERAADHLAEMRIVEAQAQQSQAQLDIVRYRLDHASIRAGFDGVVVEGDLRERIGAPVKQGDALFKVARIDRLYAEADINETDVQHILGSTQGEIAFVSQPRVKYPVTIQAIEPAAVTKKEGNVFLVRLQPQKPAIWWRPGMTGLSKVVAERESLFWIVTHRTVDFLRMKLWW
jgi:multidrug resistance efflux pump